MKHEFLTKALGEQSLLLIRVEFDSSTDMLSNNSSRCKSNFLGRRVFHSKDEIIRSNYGLEHQSRDRKFQDYWQGYFKKFTTIVNGISTRVTLAARKSVIEYDRIEFDFSKRRSNRSKQFIRRPMEHDIV